MHGVARLRDDEMRAWQALLHSYHEVIRTLDRELRDEHDLTLASYDVLVRLARAPERSLRMTELARRVLITPSGVTRMIDGLVDRGMVRRKPAPDDGRVALASLTAAGLRTVRAAARTHLRGIQEHFTGKLSRTQLRAVASALEFIAGPHEPH